MGYLCSRSSSCCDGDLKELKEGWGWCLGERQGEWQLYFQGKACQGEVLVYSFLIQTYRWRQQFKEMSLSQIAASEELMKIALTGQQHVDALIGYYRSEIDRYNDERAEWALHYQMLKDNASNKYTLQQQIDLSRHKINDLESTLNTTKANLNKERQRYFEMLQHNQAVKDRLEQNKKKYRDLVAVCKPINVAKSKKPSSNHSSKLNESSGKSNSEIQLQLINIGKEHDSKRTVLHKQIDRLKEQLDSVISEHSTRGNACSKEYKSALSALAEAEAKIMHLTSEYFKLRMNTYEEERRVQEENEILRLKAVALAKKLQMLRDTHGQEFRSVEREVKQRNKEFQLKYDEQLRKKEEHLGMVKEQNDKINHIYLLKLKKLEGELKDTTLRQKAVEERGRSEINSLRGQIKILRARLDVQGVNQMRAQMAEGEDESEQSSQTLSMSELQKLNREVDALKKKI